MVPPSSEMWRAWMEPVRRAARRLAADGQLEFWQGGQRVDGAVAKGPIRLRACPPET